MPDPAAIRDAGPWAIAIFVLLLVIVAILRGDLVPGWIHKRTDAERTALRAELDKLSDQDSQLALAVAEMAKAIKALKVGKSKGRSAH